MKAKALSALGGVLAAVVSFTASADATYDGATLYTKAKVSNAFVSTGYQPKGSTVVRAKYSPSGTANGCLYCARYDYSTRSSTKPDFSFFVSVDEKIRFDYYAKTYGGNKGISANAVYELGVEGGKATVTSGGEKFDSVTADGVATFDSPYTMYLFASCSQSSGGATPTSMGNYFAGSFYYLQIFEASSDGVETLVHDFVPCKTADGSVGIADRVTQTVVVASGLTVNEEDVILPDVGLEIKGSPADYGIPDPAYGKHEDASGTMTATAPATWENADSTLVATCMGWTLTTKSAGEVASGTGNSATFAVPSDFATLTWIFSRQYKVSAEIGVGEGSLEGVGLYAEGATATVTAVPAEGFEFKGWSGDVGAADPMQATIEITVDGAKALKAAFLPVGSEPVQYVATTGDDSAGGFTPDTPKLTVAAAVAAIADLGGTVYVAPGTYGVSGPVVISSAITVIGTGDDPAETVIRNSLGYTYGRVGRVFELGNAEAKLVNLTVADGMMGAGSGNDEGGGVRLMAGTVTNCVIRNCFARQASNPKPQGGGVYLGGADALVTHCVISNCSVHADANWIGACGAGAHIAAGRIENSLIIDCHTHNDFLNSAAWENVVGGIYLSGGSAVNCTVLSCYGSKLGGINAEASASVVNCVAYGCWKRIQVTDSGSGAKTMVETMRSAFAGTAAAFSSCASDAEETDGVGSIFGLEDDDFVDYANGDYAPANGKSLYDAGQMPEAYPELDLAGNPRVVGASIDIGCFEGSASSILVVGDPENYGAAEPGWGAHSGLTGEQTFTAAATYEADTVKATCTGWALYVQDENSEWVQSASGSGTSATITVPGGAAKLEWKYARQFKVSASVVGGASVACDEWVDENGSAVPVVTPEPGWSLLGWIDAAGNVLGTPDSFTVTNVLAVTALMLPDGVAAPVQYVSPGGSDENDGFTSETPKRSIGAAVAVLAQYGEYGGTAYVEEGMYPITSSVTLSRPIKVLGLGRDAEDIVVYRDDPRVGKGARNSRIFTLESPEALVASLVMSNGFLSGQVPGSGCYIDKLGGTVSNCVVRNCSNDNAYQAPGAVYVANLNGLVTHTVVEDSSISDENRYGGTKGCGIHLGSGARAENCLVRNCFTVATAPTEAGYPVSVGGIYAGPSAKVKNCTVIGCRATLSGGIFAAENSSVVNCAVYGCDYTGEKDPGAKDKAWAGTAANFANCATDGAAEINDTCVLIDGTAFKSVAEGDFVPATGGPLVDGGMEIPGWEGAIDLSGKARVRGKAIDIGAYEGFGLGFGVFLR